MSPEGRLGILAGRGELPWIAARRARLMGEDVHIFSIYDDEPPAEFRDVNHRIILTKLYSSTIRIMKKWEIRRLILLGKATRDILYDHPRFDLRSIILLARMASQSDYSLFDTVSREFEKKGIHIIEQNKYLKELFLPSGRYGRKCTLRELHDVSFGMYHAREINRLDIGQTVVVGKKSVLAVEGAEGTDNCVRRGGELFHKKGAIVCKVAKINHDMRFDIPATGAATLKTMKEAGCRVLAIESARTFVLDPPGFITAALKAGITVLAVDPEKTDLACLKKINARAAKKVV